MVSFALPLATIAAMYARLPELLPRQRAAMRSHPGMIAGPGDLDTELPPALPGAVAKGGAEGLGCVSLGEQGLGVAVRVEDGDYRAVEPDADDGARPAARLVAAATGRLASSSSPSFATRPATLSVFLRADVPLTRA